MTTWFLDPNKARSEPTEDPTSKWTPTQAKASQNMRTAGCGRALFPLHVLGEGSSRNGNRKIYAYIYMASPPNGNHILLANVKDLTLQLRKAPTIVRLQDCKIARFCRGVLAAILQSDLTLATAKSTYDCKIARLQDCKILPGVLAAILQSGTACLRL